MLFRAGPVPSGVRSIRSPARRCPILRPRSQEPPTDRGPRRNRQIRISPIRLIDDEGKQVGIVETLDALRLAEERGLDLVEVSPEARPPVCKLMDYGRFKYEQAQIDKQRRRNAADSAPKEIRLRPNTDKHDIEIKAAHAREFLEEGHKVRVTLRFRGAEMRRQDVGRETLKQIVAQLQDCGRPEGPPGEMEGRNLSIQIAPLK